MPLASTSLEITLFQILDIPYATTVTTLDGFGNLGPNFTFAAKTAVLNYVNSLDSNTIAELSTLLTDFAAISTSPAKMEGGSVGSLQGLSYDYSAKRDFIYKRVLTIVPFPRHHEVLAKLNNTGNGCSVEVLH